MLTNSSVNFSIPMISQTPFESTITSQAATSISFHISTPINISTTRLQDDTYTTSDLISVPSINIQSTPFSPTIEVNSIESIMERLDKRMKSSFECFTLLSFDTYYRLRHKKLKNCHSFQVKTKFEPH